MSKNTGRNKEIIKKTSIGGQALLEGIMMRGPQKTAMAVRKPSGEMVVETNENAASSRPRFTKLPIVRGTVNFVDSMVSGYRYLMRSAEIGELEGMIEDNPKKDACDVADTATGESTCDAGGSDDGDAATDATSAAEASADESKTEEVGDNEKDGANNKEKSTEKDDDKISRGAFNAIMAVGMVLGVALALFLFKVIPESLYQGLVRLVPAFDGEGYGYSLLRSAITGCVKIAILVGYMAAVSLMKDIRRTFMYHGAEHKTIFCYEMGLELTVENVRRQRRFHPRCGTSFLILMLLISVIVNMFIPAKIVSSGVLNVIARTGIGLLLLPLVVGIGYEVIKFAGRHDNVLTRIISAPGVWLQHVTTKEPTDDMIECAIAALREVVPSDGSDKW